jgi:hypothetical protein
LTVPPSYDPSTSVPKLGIIKSMSDDNTPILSTEHQLVALVDLIDSKIKALDGIRDCLVNLANLLEDIVFKMSSMDDETQDESTVSKDLN